MELNLERNQPGEDRGCSFRGTPRIDLMTTEIGSSRLSYSSNGPRDLWPGVSNYVLQVLSRTHDDPALLMYFLDSGGGSYTEVISSAQVKWFQSQSQFLNPNGRSGTIACDCLFIRGETHRNLSVHHTDVVVRCCCSLRIP
jgi:hypothetical protein